MKVEANGVALNCEVSGKEGAPWLTFSNSLATNLHMWDDQAAALADDFRILRYDKRGHGKSDVPDGAYDFSMLVGDVVGLWDALGIERSHFVGLSIGGMTAMGLALDHAARLDSIVISNAIAEAPAPFVAAWDERIAIVEQQGMEALARPTVERWSSDPFLDSGTPVLDDLRAMVAATPAGGFVGCARALQGLDFEKRLGEIRTRTLFIAGKEDGATPAATMSRLAELVEGAEYVELSPAGHLSNIEQPAGYTAALRDFLL
ncbi:MAG: 3-oxoadipate enol-lactonase [Defluviicoccus sp.]|nr:3-oxoadipate enol-lactonase [Defluviicoccus sp.]MDE0383889.1 3-oxoadipate enol-lactonase [Defluviicoccus sp.]